MTSQSSFRFSPVSPFSRRERFLNLAAHRPAANGAGDSGAAEVATPTSAVLAAAMEPLTASGTNDDLLAQGQGASAA